MQLADYYPGSQFREQNGFRDENQQMNNQQGVKLVNLMQLTKRLQTSGYLRLFF